MKKVSRVKEENTEAKIINITTKEQLDNLYNSSALTLEGLTPEDNNTFHDWVLAQGATTDGNVYNISGEFMNEAYGLTGSNAYPEDLNIACIKFSNIGKLVMARFQIGARWFDDVVDNNTRREGEKDEACCKKKKCKKQEAEDEDFLAHCVKKIKSKYPELDEEDVNEFAKVLVADLKDSDFIYKKMEYLFDALGFSERYPL